MGFRKHSHLEFMHTFKDITFSPTSTTKTKTFLLQKLDIFFNFSKENKQTNIMKHLSALYFRKTLYLVLDFY